MAENPFAAPQAGGFELSAGPREAGSFDIGVSLSEAWSLTWKNFGVLLGGTLVIGLLMMLSAVTVIGVFVLLPVLSFGMYRLHLNAIDGRAEFSDIFAGFKNFGQALGSMFVVVFASLLLSAPGYVLNMFGAASGEDSLGLLGTVVSLGMMVVQVRILFAAFFIVDQNMGGFDALSASWNATRGLWGRSILLLILATVIVTFGAMLFLIGMIPAFFIMMLMIASAYRQMFPRGTAA